MRTFLAFTISATPAVVQARRELEPFASLLKLTSADQFHVTLKFLGNTNDSQVEGLIESIGQIVEITPHFDVLLHGLGAFPSLERPNVFWIGIAPNPALEKLAREIERHCEILGWPTEDRKYHPHLTLARIKDNFRAPVALIEHIRARAQMPIGVQRIETIALYCSELLPSGAVYSVIHEWKLGLKLTSPGAGRGV